MEDLKSSEQRATVEDLMYASVLEKFLELKVEMMPRYAYLKFCAWLHRVIVQPIEPLSLLPTERHSYVCPRCPFWSLIRIEGKLV